MKFPQPLQSGVLVRRYKRFLVDIALDDGTILTAHCPNTGAMTGCKTPGMRAFFSHSHRPERKYPHTLEWLQVSPEHRACINTQLPNRLVKEAIEQGLIGELQGYSLLRSEQRYGRQNSRIDWLLSGHEARRPNCYLEVKNATLVEDAVGYFPDAVSLRALRHIEELIWVAEQGYRAVLLFCANHTGMRSLRPADKIDVNYADVLRHAVTKGVELLAYRSEMDAQSIRLLERVPVEL